MAKIDMDEIINSLNLAGITGEPRQVFLEKLKTLAAENSSERQPRKKSEVVVVLKTREGLILTDEDVTASVYSMPEGEDAATLLDSIRAASVDSNIVNETKKKPTKISTFTETLALLKPRYQKDRKFKGLTKQWSRCLVITPEQDAKFVKPKVKETESFD